MDMVERVQAGAVLYSEVDGETMQSTPRFVRAVSEAAQREGVLTVMAETVMGRTGALFSHDALVHPDIRTSSRPRGLLASL